MHKAPIVESKQIEHVINERRILEEASHPFCVRLCGAYQDRDCLYLLQEWVPGGELFHHLDVEGAFDEPTAMFYAANVLLALEFLHAKNIVYRDLKPENLLMDTQGYIKVADFGFAKHIGGDKTFTICGTPDYQAPEVIMRRGTTKAADYWALGVLIFEMLVGDPPFKSLTGDPWDTFRRTLSGRFYVPNFISDSAADLIFKLLQVNPDKRLGSDKLTGAEDIKRHKWFSRVDWRALEQKKMPAPFRPRVRNPLDTSNFDNFDAVDVEPPAVPADRLEKHAQLWELWEKID
nr:cGMp-dependent protein kinase (PRKG) [Polytomella parva]